MFRYRWQRLIEDSDDHDTVDQIAADLAVIHDTVDRSKRAQAAADMRQVQALTQAKKRVPRRLMRRE